jgi:small conductance mechanosensitive channel
MSLRSGLPILTPLPLPAAETPCSATDGPWCEVEYQVTGADWLARASSVVIDGAIKTVLIVALAVLVRGLLHRGVSRLAQGAGEGQLPALLRPLRDRGAQRLQMGAMLSERRRQRAATIGSLLRSVVSLVIYGIAFVLILGEFGVNLAPIVASAGVIGLAVGFGAQNLVKDFLSGIFMMLEDQYGIGDTVDLGPASGTVESIGLRVTTIRDAEGTLWYVRNGEISRVGNHSHHFSIALIDVPVGHGTNIPRATAIAETAAREAVTEASLAAKVLDEVTVLGVQSVTAEAVTLRLTVTTKPGQQVAVRRTMFGAVSTAFAQAQISPPTAAPATALPT